jgi:hypothetical protein
MQFSGDNLVMDLHLVSGRFDDKGTLGCSSGASVGQFSCANCSIISRILLRRSTKIMMFSAKQIRHCCEPQLQNNYGIDANPILLLETSKILYQFYSARAGES